MKPQEMPEMSSEAPAKTSTGIWPTLCWSIVGMSALFSLVFWLVPDHLELLAGEYLVCSPNTFRDFDVYGLVSQGLLPLEGPSTSIGGHHGYLAYWLIGGWFSLIPTFQGLQVFGILVLFVSLTSSFVLARRVSSVSWAFLGTTVFLASPILFLIHYPNHIVLIPVATTLSLYALFRCSESWLWTILTSTAVVVGIGSHRTGWLLLLAVIVLNWRFGFQWFRRGLGLVPVALYAIPEVISRWTVELASKGGDGRSFFGDMEPLLVLLTMPFHQFREDGGEPIRWLELAFVVLCLWWCFRATAEKKEGRALWWFYLLHFVAYPFYRFDLQYYMGMFSVLPALVAMAMSDQASNGRRWVLMTTGGILGALILFNGMSMHRQIEFVKQPESKHFRSVAPELETIRQLDAAGATPEEVLRCGEFPFFERSEFSVFYRTFSTAVESEETPRYRYLLKLVTSDGSESPQTAVTRFDDYELHRIPAPPTCRAEAKSWTENLLYWSSEEQGVVVR